MDHQFTQQIGDWLKQSADERDYTVGALYLLKLSGNQILYKNVIANIERHKSVVEYQLQKYYNFRVQALTHEQVEAMAAEVETIAEEHSLTSEPEPEPRKGKRADHDELPDEIRACYVENLSILQRMRELHLRLRSMTLTDSPCPDSERYPFLKELIALDKKMHRNWEKYDHYKPE